MALLMEVSVAAAVVGVTVLLVRFLLNYVHFHKLVMAIPGAPGAPSLPLLGHALVFLSATEDTVLQTIRRLVADRTGLTRVTILNRPIVVASDPDDIAEVTHRKDLNDKSEFFYNLVHVFAKRGLLQLGGADWKVHRKWLLPGFNKSVLDRFVEVFREETRDFVDRLKTDGPYDVTEQLRRMALRNFLRTSLDNDISVIEDTMLGLCMFADVFLKSVNERAFNPLLWSDFVFLLTPRGREVMRMLPVLRETVKTMISMRRTEGTGSGEQRLRTLMEIVCDESEGGKQMPEQDVTDEVTTFFAANVETTVSATCWMLKVLSLLPEVQERVYAEVLEVLGASDKEITAEDLPRLQYVGRVVKELLRMFPPLPLIARQCYSETKLCGFTVPAATTVAINILGAHYDRRHWEEPERFDPDRFLPENTKDRHPCAFIAFSSGPRNCIGYRYAMNNLTLFTATVVRSHRVLPAGDHKDLKSLRDNMAFAVTSRLVGGLRVQFAKRRAPESPES